MIIGFASRETELIWDGHFSRKLPREIQRLIRRKLGMLDAAYRIEDLQVPPSNRLEVFRGTGKVATASGSMIDGEFASCGWMETARPSRSSTITKN